MNLKVILPAAFSMVIGIALGQTKTRLTTESNHSTIGFSIPISGGITRVTGKFMDFDLKLDYVDNDLTQSSAIFVIQVASINTGISERDDHLKTADFFDAETFPEISFQSTGITKVGDGYAMEGNLSMHGVTKTAIIPFAVLHQENNQLGIQIRWKLNRIEFGVGENFSHTSMENFLGEEIDVEINFWTKRDKRE